MRQIRETGFMHKRVRSLRRLRPPLGPELADADDVQLRKGARPAGYPNPIVDHGTERSEALRRYGDIR